MSVLRGRATVVATILMVGSGCSDAPAGPALGDLAVVESARLEVRGGDGADDIRIVATPEGARVQVAGQSGLFEETIRAILVDAGAGDDVIRVEQSLVRDVELDVLGGAGDDVVTMTFAPSDGGTTMSLSADVDTGPGSDATAFFWDSKGSDLEASVALTVEGTVSLPEVDDEVLVGFESGDPARPVIVGGLWNGAPPSDAGSAGDAHSFGFQASLTNGGPQVEVRLAGGAGRDNLSVEADYSGVEGQQGRIVLDADVNEGRNHVGTYIVTGGRHTYLETGVVAGGGGNTIVMEDRIGGDVERVYDVEVGDGDNAMTIRFGDAPRGARLPTGTRNVTARYRSGGGYGNVSLTAELVEPLTSDLTVDLGEGQGAVRGEYDLPAAPADGAPTGVQAASSRVGVSVISPNESDLDFIVRMADPDPDDGVGGPGAIALEGSGVRGGRLDFLRLLDVPTQPGGGAGAAEEEWTLRLDDLMLGGPASLTATSGGAVRRLVYLQERAEIDAGAFLDVALEGHDGADAMLAHLLGVSGDGAFDLVMDGGGGGDFGAALTRSLDPTGGGALAFEVRGGDGDDQAAVEAPVDLQRGGPVAHRIDAGAGTDACYASEIVAAVGCESREGITAQLLKVLEDLFGSELAGAWGGGG